MNEDPTVALAAFSGSGDLRSICSLGTAALSYWVVLFLDIFHKKFGTSVRGV